MKANFGTALDHPASVGLRFPGLHIDNCADGILAIKGGAWSVDHLDLFGIAHAEVASDREQLTTWRIDPHAVDQHDDLVVANDPPYRYGRGNFGIVILSRLHPRKITKNIL